ncbi:MAG: GDSL-type esterase/lipase family protein [Planctomycetota bacterium]
MSRLAKLALLVAITAVLLETVLQLGALGFWLFYPRVEASGPEDARVVLCIGDSYTYGMGTTTPEMAYPAQLERALTKSTGEPWRVVNAGWPGRNSRDVLERIDGLLARHAPSLVYLMIGTNDGWSRPERLTLETAQAPATASGEAGDAAGKITDEPFKVEWRTPKLFALFAAALRPAPEAAALTDPTAPLSTAPPSTERETAAPATTGAPKPARQHATPGVLGAWRGPDDTTYEFRADGQCLIGGHPFPWSVDDRTLHLALPGGRELEAEVTGDAQLLRLRLAGGGELPLRAVAPQTAAPPAAAPTAPPKPANGWAQLKRGEFAAAEQTFRALLDDAAPHSAPAVNARAALAQTYQRWGKREQSLAEMAKLRALYEAVPSRAAGTSLLMTLERCGTAEEARAFAKTLREAFPAEFHAHRAYAFLSFQAKDLEAAQQAIDAATALPQGAKNANAWRVRARIYRDVDPDVALQSALRAFAIDGDPAVARRMHLYRRRIDDHRFDELLAELVPDPERRTAVHELWYEDRDAEQREVGNVFRSHLRQLVERSQAAGAQPVVVTYPFGARYPEAVQEVVAETKAGYLPIHEAFAKARREQPGRSLFAADGHCNDDGYGLLARMAATDALRRTQGR